MRAARGAGRGASGRGADGPWSAQVGHRSSGKLGRPRGEPSRRRSARPAAAEAGVGARAVVALPRQSELRAGRCGPVHARPALAVVPNRGARGRHGAGVSTPHPAVSRQDGCASLSGTPQGRFLPAPTVHGVWRGAARAPGGGEAVRLTPWGGAVWLLQEGPGCGPTEGAACCRTGSPAHLAPHPTPTPMVPSFYRAIDLCPSIPGRVCQQLPASGQRSLPSPGMRQPGHLLLFWPGSGGRLASPQAHAWSGGLLFRVLTVWVPPTTTKECAPTLLGNGPPTPCLGPPGASVPGSHWRVPPTLRFPFPGLSGGSGICSAPRPPALAVITRLGPRSFGSCAIGPAGVSRPPGPGQL